MDKKELKEIIKEDKKFYFGEKKDYYRRFLLSDNYRKIGKLIIYARKYGYYYENKDKSIINRILYFYYGRKKNRLGTLLNIELGPIQFGKKLMIYHNNIIINRSAIIGDNVKLHGNICIGNKGEQKERECPVIGNGVDIGYGAVIIGKINIGDNVKISAQSLVNKSFEKGIIGGIPAKILNM